MKEKLKSLFNNNKNKVLADVFLNIVANAVPIATLQLVVYPITAKVLGADEYGLMITIYSVWMVISYSLGNVLNNVRLLNNNSYVEKGVTGDFRILLNRWVVVNITVVIALSISYYEKITPAAIISAAVIAVLFMLKSYLEVGFRIKLNYVAIFITNTLQAAGFIIGCFITYKTGYWQAIFLCGYLCSCLYSSLKTGLLKEPQVKTELFHKVSKEANELTIATVLGCLSDYADKLVLYPLMGGYTVSIYYTATILGKIVGMMTGPINSVVLSYITRWKNSRKDVLKTILGVGVCVVIVGYVMTLLVSGPVLRVLFPQWADEVLKYIPVTTITVCLSILITFVQPFVLRFCDVKWQMLISGVGLSTYFCASLLLWHYFGLMGFCVGTNIGVFSKLLMMLIIYYRNNDKNEKNEQTN